LSRPAFGGNVPPVLEVFRRIEAGIRHLDGATVNDEPHGPFGGNAAIQEFTRQAAGGRRSPPCWRIIRFDMNA
jgi:hypothetical protein